LEADVELTMSEVLGGLRGLTRLKTSRDDVNVVNVMMAKARRDVYLPHLLEIRILSDGGVASPITGHL
jgi:hypothetical protein